MHCPAVAGCALMAEQPGQREVLPQAPVGEAPGAAPPGGRVLATHPAAQAPLVGRDVRREHLDPGVMKLDLPAQGGAGDPLAPQARPCAHATCLAPVTLCMVYESTRQPGGAWAASPSRRPWLLTGAMWKLLHGQVGGLGGALLLAPPPVGLLSLLLLFFFFGGGGGGGGIFFFGGGGGGGVIEAPLFW